MSHHTTEEDVEYAINVIAESAEAAFGWSDKDVSLMQLWMYGTYLASMFPFAWLMHKKGKLGQLEYTPHICIQCP